MTSTCMVRIPLGHTVWRSSDDRQEHRRMARFLLPLYFEHTVDLGDEQRIERIVRQMQFDFLSYRTSAESVLIKLNLTYLGSFVEATIGGCVGDVLRVDDKIDALIEFHNAEYVSVEFSHDLRDTLTARPDTESPIAVERVQTPEWTRYHDAAQTIGEALHNARNLIKTVAGDNAPIIRQVDLAIAAIPVRFRPI